MAFPTTYVFSTGTATLWGSPCLAASTRKKTLPLCKKISTPPLPRTAPNKPFSPAAFGRLFYLRCALPCTPGCRTEYAVGEAFHSHSKGASAYEKSPAFYAFRLSVPVSPRPSRVFSSPCPATALPLSVSPTRPAPLPTSPLKTPSCALSLQKDNTIRPYAVVDLTAAKAGFRTVRIQGVQIFAGQVTLAQPEMIPETEEDRDVVNPPIVIPEHSLFTGDGGSGPDPMENCVPRVLDRVIIPKKHHGASGQACGIRPQCDCLLPGLYRQCCIQRSLPYLAGAGPAGQHPLPDLAGTQPHLHRVVPQQGLHLQHHQLHQLRPVLCAWPHRVRCDGAHH